MMTTRPVLLALLVFSFVFSGCMDVSDPDWSDTDEHRQTRDRDHQHHHVEEDEHDHRHVHPEGTFCAPGGIEDDDVRAAWNDADERWNNLLDGNEDTRRTFEVQPRTSNLRVSLLFDLHGDVDFRLRDPLGRTAAETDFDGHKEQEEDGWYETRSPLPGRWTLDIDLSARGGYAVGVYH